MYAANAFFRRWFPGEINQDCAYHDRLAVTLPRAGRILDLGCGDNSALARYRTADLEVWGTDFAAHPRLQHPDWFRPLGAAGTIPFRSGELDVVTSYMVMEHVDDPARFLGEIARVLKPGGVYVGQSIHSLHYVTWIRRLFGLVPHRWVQRLVKKLYGREENDTFPTRYRLNRRGVIARVAQASHLEWVDWRGYAAHGYFAFSPVLFGLGVMADWCLDGFFSGLGKIYFTVVLRKPAAAGGEQETMPVAKAA